MVLILPSPPAPIVYHVNTVRVYDLTEQQITTPMTFADIRNAYLCYYNLSVSVYITQIRPNTPFIPSYNLTRLHDVNTVERSSCTKLTRALREANWEKYLINDIPNRKLQATYSTDIIMDIYVNVTVPSSSFTSYLTKPWNLVEVTPTPTETASSITLVSIALVVVGCTVGAVILGAMFAGIHVGLKRRSENTRLVSSSVNPLNKPKQTKQATVLPSRKFLDYKDDTDNRVSFPPV